MQSITLNVYVVRWVVEQGEDLYDVLVDGKTVVHVQIPRASNNEQISFQTWPVADHLRIRKDLPRPDRRRFELALKLAAEQRL